jgi:hypothetical protein
MFTLMVTKYGGHLQVLITDTTPATIIQPSNTEIIGLIDIHMITMDTIIQVGVLDLDGIHGIGIFILVGIIIILITDHTIIHMVITMDIMDMVTTTIITIMPTTTELLVTREQEDHQAIRLELLGTPLQPEDQVQRLELQLLQQEELHQAQKLFRQIQEHPEEAHLLLQVIQEEAELQPDIVQVPEDHIQEQMQQEVLTLLPEEVLMELQPAEQDMALKAHTIRTEVHIPIHEDQLLMPAITIQEEQVHLVIIKQKRQQDLLITQQIALQEEARVIQENQVRVLLTQK